MSQSESDIPSSVTPFDERDGIVVQRELRSRGRVYLHVDELHELDIHDPHGQTIYVAISVPSDYDPLSNWSSHERAEGYTDLGHYGEFTVPAAVRSDLDLTEGDILTVYTECI